MILLADESVERAIILRLRKEGYEVFSVAEISPGISDDAVLQLSNDRLAYLLTEDKDFGFLIVHQKQRSARGVLLIRLPGVKDNLKADWVARTFMEHKDELMNAISVLTEEKVRIRKL